MLRLPSYKYPSIPSKGQFCLRQAIAQASVPLRRSTPALGSTLAQANTLGQDSTLVAQGSILVQGNTLLAELSFLKGDNTQEQRRRVALSIQEQPLECPLHKDPKPLPNHHRRTSRKLWCGN